MTQGLSHNIKRVTAGLCALMVVTGTVPMQPVADLYKSISISASAGAATVPTTTTTYTVTLSAGGVEKVVTETATSTNTEEAITSDMIESFLKDYVKSKHSDYKFYNTVGQPEVAGNTISVIYKFSSTATASPEGADLGSVIITVTYTSNKTAPNYQVSAANPTYNEQPQDLVTTTGAGGAIHYRLGTNGEWGTTIPKATDCSENGYTVYWYSEADDTYSASGSAEQPNSVECSIAKATLTAGTDYTAPTAANTANRNGLYYTGSAQALVNAGSVAQGKGTMEYALGSIQARNMYETYTPVVGETVKPYGEGGVYFPVGYGLKIGGSTYGPSSANAQIQLWYRSGEKTVSSSENKDAIKSAWGEHDSFTVIGVDDTNKVVAIKFVDSENVLNWQSGEGAIPTATEIDTYSVSWRITGNNNYKTVQGVITNEIEENTTAVMLSNLGDDPVIAKKAEGNGESDILTATSNAYTLTGGGIYYLFTDKTVAEADNAGSIATLEGKNKKVSNGDNAKTYNYRYKLEIPVVPADSYPLSHTNNWQGSVDTSKSNKLYVADGGVNTNDETQLAAELQSTGYLYYGDEVSDANVKIKDGFSTLVHVGSVYLTNSSTGARVTMNDALPYGEYTLTAQMLVDNDGDENFSTGIQRECILTTKVTYAKRPMSENEYYLVPDDDSQPPVINRLKNSGGRDDNDPDWDEGDSQTLIKLKTDEQGNIIVPKGTFTYDGKAKKPNIVVKNGGNQATLTLDTDYTSTAATKTAVGDYSFTLTAKEGSSYYTDSVTVKWSIDKAAAFDDDELDAQESKKYVTNKKRAYNTKQLNGNDFTFDAGQNTVLAAMLADEATTITVESVKGTEAVTQDELDAVYNQFRNNSNCTNDTTLAGYLAAIEGKSLDNGAEYGNSSVGWGTGIYIDNADGKSVYRCLSFSYHDGVLSLVGDGNTATINCTSAPVITKAEVTSISGIRISICTDGTAAGAATDMISAGDHTANITVESPNYKTVKFTGVPATITKRKVTLTPNKGQFITYGEEAAPEIEYETEMAEFDKDGNVIGETGFIEIPMVQSLSRPRIIDIIDQEPAAALAPPIRIGKLEDSEKEFDYDTFANQAGDYKYELDQEAVDKAAEANAEFKNYELKIDEKARFTVKPRELTVDMFNWDQSAWVRQYTGDMIEGPDAQFIYDRALDTTPNPGSQDPDDGYFGNAGETLEYVEADMSSAEAFYADDLPEIVKDSQEAGAAKQRAIDWATANSDKIKFNDDNHAFIFYGKNANYYFGVNIENNNGVITGVGNVNINYAYGWPQIDGIKCYVPEITLATYEKATTSKDFDALPVLETDEDITAAKKKAIKWAEANIDSLEFKDDFVHIVYGVKGNNAYYIYKFNNDDPNFYDGNTSLSNVANATIGGGVSTYTARAIQGGINKFDLSNDGYKGISDESFIVMGERTAGMPGTYRVEVEGQGNYCGSIELDWIVVPDDQKYFVDLHAESFMYDGKDAEEERWFDDYDVEERPAVVAELREWSENDFFNSEWASDIDFIKDGGTSDKAKEWADAEKDNGRFGDNNKIAVVYKTEENNVYYLMRNGNDWDDSTTTKDNFRSDWFENGRLKEDCELYTYTSRPIPAGGEAIDDAEITLTYYNAEDFEGYDFNLTPDSENYVPLNDYAKNLEALDGAPKDAGEYVVIATADSDSYGYDFGFSHAEFRIDQREIYVEPEFELKKTYGDEDPDMSFNIEVTAENWSDSDYGGPVLFSDVDFTASGKFVIGGSFRVAGQKADISAETVAQANEEDAIAFAEEEARRDPNLNAAVVFATENGNVKYISIENGVVGEGHRSEPLNGFTENWFDEDDQLPENHKVWFYSDYNGDAGEYQMVLADDYKITGELNARNYKLIADDGLRFTVSSRKLKDNVDIKATDKALFTGAAINPYDYVEIKDGLVKDRDYKEMSATSTKKAGTHKVTIKGIGNYTGMASAYVEVVSSESIDLDVANPVTSVISGKNVVRLTVTSDNTDGFDGVTTGLVIYKNAEEPEAELTIENAAENGFTTPGSAGNIYYGKVVDEGEGIWYRPYVTLSNNTIYGEMQYVSFAELKLKETTNLSVTEPKMAIISGKNVVKLTVNATNTENAEITATGLVISKTAEEPEAELTIENAAENGFTTPGSASGTYFGKIVDGGEGIWYRPYTTVNGITIYGETQYASFAELLEASTEINVTEPQATVIGSKNVVRITVTANNTSGFEITNTGFVISKTAEEPEAELTIENAAENGFTTPGSASGTYFGKIVDTGTGIWYRPYVTINGVTVYGDTQYASYDDLTNNMQ